MMEKLRNKQAISIDRKFVIDRFIEILSRADLSEGDSCEYVGEYAS